jgi:single-stranded-DNA-specific exonuclease
LPGVEKAAERIADAVRRGENIVIYGDYDADGTAAIGLLVRCLKMIGAEVGYYVPSRLDEGYGLNMEAMARLIERRSNLVVSVDCGVTAFEEAEFLASKGVDLIITDHHEPMERLPRAFAIVNPKVAGPEQARNTSGVGVAFKLAWAIMQQFSQSSRVSDEFRDFLCDALSLVALGTIADVVPLTGENRAMVSYGLGVLSDTRMPGLRALVDSAGLGGKMITPHQVAFQLAPLLNAAGRMSDARTAVELMITDDTLTAQNLAAELESHNAERRRIGEQMLAEAREEALGFRDALALVLGRREWHSGIIGIVAGKLAEEFNKPAIVFSVEDELCQGSARSTPELNIFEALKNVSDLLLTFGGHSQAAGLKIPTARLADFRARFSAEVARALGGVAPERKLRVDAEVRLETLSRACVEEIERLAPFGAGNPRPVLAASAVEIIGQPKRMGGDGQHASFFVRSAQASLRVVAFNFPHDCFARLERGNSCDIAFEARDTLWNNTSSVELFLKDIAFEQ